MSSPAVLRLPPALDELDRRVDELWEHLRGHPPIDMVFYAASAAGDFSAIWHVYNLVRHLRAAEGEHHYSRLATALALESLLVNQVIKRSFRRARPVEDRVRPHRLRVPLTSSFPSGHASSAAMAASLLREGGRGRTLTVVLASVVATSRLHVRIHHASDVVAGVLVGTALAAVWKRVWPLSPAARM